MQICARELFANLRNSKNKDLSNKATLDEEGKDNHNEKAENEI